MKNAKAKIEEISSNGYPFDFGTVFEQSFENYKKIALNAGLVTLLMAIVFCVIGKGIFASIYGLSSFTETMTNLNPESFEGGSLVIQFFVIVTITAFVTPINAGILKMSMLADKGEEFSISTAFDYYSSSYLKNIIIASILLASFTTTIDLGLEALGFKFIGTIISIILSFFTLLYLPLIVFGNLSAIDAIIGSVNVVSKQIVMIAALLIVVFILSMLGAFACCIGIIFTLPFLSSTHYMIYKQVIGIDNSSELDEIGQNFE